MEHEDSRSREFVAARLKTLIDERNLTGSKLSTLCGVSQPMVSGILRGAKMPTVETLSIICDALGITLAEFFDGPIDEAAEGISPEEPRRYFQYSDRLRELCAERGWDEYRLAKESGVPPAKIKQYLAGEKIPGLPSLEKICKGLGVALSEFFSVDGEPTIDPDEPVTIGRVVFDDGTVANFADLPPEAQEQVKNFLRFTMEQYKDK